jgi:hypothetical protein
MDDIDKNSFDMFLESFGADFIRQQEEILSRIRMNTSPNREVETPLPSSVASSSHVSGKHKGY